jgi:O-antigen/teichoic acid export membrane protein
MRFEVMARSIAEPYAAIVATIVAWGLGFGTTGLLIGYWAGTLAALGYALLGARRSFGGFGLRRWRPSRAETATILRACAVPTFADFASAMFTRLDIYLVGLMLGEAPAGVYGMARQLRTPIRQVRQSFDGLLTPLIARTLAASGAEATGLATASASRLILAIQLPLLVASIVIGLPLLHWLGPAFAAGYWALVLLAAAETIQGAFGVSDLILLYRRPSLALAITFVSAAVNLVAGWLLIRGWGVDGAALAALLAMIAGALVRRLALRRFMGVSVPLVHGAGPVVAAVLATLGAALLARTLAPGPDLAVYGPALAAALAIYGCVLGLWIKVTGQSLRLVNFRAE